MKRVILTGWNGFVGRNIKMKLEEDFELILIENDFIERPDWEKELEYSVECTDIILHIGAISDTTLQDQNEMLKYNYDFSKKLFDFAKKHNKKVIYASSAANDGVDGTPTNIYGWSKLLAEQYGVALDFDFIALRYFNVYGPGEEIKGKISAMLSAKGNNINTELSDNVLETWAFIGDESYDDSDNNQIAIRRLFVPRPNYSLISFDYSQMEVRVFMSYFRNEVIDALLNKDDVDFHGEAAKLAFKVTETDSQYKFYRQMAKAITFGTIYGIGNKKLAEQLNTTPKEAGQYKKRYFEGLVGSKEFFDKVIDTVSNRGWIKNRYGRRYEINPKFAYKGVNYLVQGTSADILSERMIEIAKFLQDKKSSILLQVHDEIICEIHYSELETVPFEIKNLLEINSLEIPLTVDMEICTPSWATKRFFEVPTIDHYIDWENASTVDSNGIEWK